MHWIRCTLDGSWDKNIIISGVDNSSSVHVDNKKRRYLDLGEGPTQGLDDTTIAAEAKLNIPLISQSQEKDLC